MTKTKIKVAHMGLGLDLLGSQTTLKTNPRTGAVLELWWEQDPAGAWHAIGLKATSGKNGRQVGVFFANLKGCELDVPLFTKGAQPLNLPPKNTPQTAGFTQSAIPATPATNVSPESPQSPQSPEAEVDPIIKAAKAKKQTKAKDVPAPTEAKI